ncbi:GNAT family N-acetyltransferase [Spirosoma jeollabukense]
MASQSTFSDTLQIRAATTGDLPTIYDFLCILEDETLDLIAFRSVFLLNLANPLIHYLVAEQEGELVGFVSCHVQYLLHHGGKVGEIQELFVRSDVRNQQIGHKLVAALEALAHQEGFVNIEVTTNQKRIDTIRFYERENFKSTHLKLVKTLL